MPPDSSPPITLGRQWIIECYQCDRVILDSPEELEPILIEAALSAGATVTGSKFNQYEPQGVSGVVFILESHFTIHTWPEYGYAGVDIFSCGKSVDVGMAIPVLKDSLKAEEVVLVAELDRGLVDESGNMRLESPLTSGTKPS